MAADPRKVGRLVAVRPPLINGTRRLRPARITAVGAGTNITCQVDTHGGAAETYTNIPRWSRSSPATTGWVRV
jgi:hypothetical protein